VVKATSDSLKLWCVQDSMRNPHSFLLLDDMHKGRPWHVNDGIDLLTSSNVVSTELSFYIWVRGNAAGHSAFLLPYISCHQMMMCCSTDVLVASIYALLHIIGMQLTWDFFYF
jgi:hypothetical protein